MKHISLLILLLTISTAISKALLVSQTDLITAVLASHSPMERLSNLSRVHDPIVISGSQLTNLSGTKTEQLFVYAYRGSAPEQIPAQIDERTDDGVFVQFEEGSLDENDELIFMAEDAGDWIAAPALETDGVTIYPAYTIMLTDPLDSSQAWAYIFSSHLLTQSFSADYITYNAAKDGVSSPNRYAFAYNGNNFRDELTLGSNPNDLLDRDKIRASGQYLFIPFSVTENNSTLESVHAIDGPVRVTRVSTGTVSIAGISFSGQSAMHAYRSLVVQPGTIIVPGLPVVINQTRISTDWNNLASGMTYYDANNHSGIIIDGIPDSPILVPASHWNQVSGSYGSVISIYRITGDISGSQSTYYLDDNTPDPDDTGDQMSYGDSGFQVNDPSEGSYELLSHSYYFSGTLGNSGAAYQEYFDNPLTIDISPYSPPQGPTATPSGTPAPTTPSPSPEPTGTITPTPTQWRVSLPYLVKSVQFSTP